LIITLSMTGKFLIAGTFALAYLYTAELFPTPVRLVEKLLISQGDSLPILKYSYIFLGVGSTFSMGM